MTAGAAISRLPSPATMSSRSRSARGETSFISTIAPSWARCPVMDPRGLRIPHLSLESPSEGCQGVIRSPLGKTSIRKPPVNHGSVILPNRIRGNFIHHVRGINKKKRAIGHRRMLKIQSYRRKRYGRHKKCSMKEMIHRHHYPSSLRQIANPPDHASPSNGSF